ncbi:hypothetical protein L596_030854 [Steinernema carpocapsae]|nr:hypothetical protein L596_030854 [Steinernema carpocapsae]
MWSWAVLLSLFLQEGIASYGPVYNQFNETAQKLMQYVTHGKGKGVAFNWLAELVDEFGHRHVGSESLEKAIDWTVDRLKKDGFDNVHTQSVPNLPHWRRGDDRVMLIEPRLHRLNILTVDGSPPVDLTAEAIVVNSFEELKNHNITGKIVIFVEKWEGYGTTVRYRAASRNEALRGAAGVLLKSVTPFSISSPHTGSGGRGAVIPSACLTIEEAEMLQRMYKRGKKLEIRMQIKSREVGKCTSRNTIFDIKGSTYPDEIVLLSGHMDSWDVGQGAMDDGGGMAVAWNALNIIKEMAKKDPRFAPKRYVSAPVLKTKCLRTLRVVFWTAEEQGMLGSQAYFKETEKDSLKKFFFVSESDQGAFKPKNDKSAFHFMGTRAQMKVLDEIVQIINDHNIPLSLVQSNDQGDVQFWSDKGVPSVNYVSDQGKDYYFYFHHTNGDYMTVFKDGDLDYVTAIFAALAHVLGNIDHW